MLASRRWTRQSTLVTLLAAITIVLVYSHYDHPTQFLTNKLATDASSRSEIPLKPLTTPVVGPYHRSRVLKGPPTESFRGKRYSPSAYHMLLNMSSR